MVWNATSTPKLPRVRTLSWLWVSIGQLPVSQASAGRGSAMRASTARAADPAARVRVGMGEEFTREPA